MTGQLPRSGLIRLNIIISTAFSVLLALFLLALNKDVADIVFRFFQTLICASLISFGNMWLFTFNGNKKSKKTRAFPLYLISYIWALLCWMFVIIMYSLVTGKPWEGEGGTVAAYVLAVLAIFFFNTVILVIQNLFIFQYRNAQNEMEKLQLKANISDTTNLLLRQQIQPHFLFNALNTVKSLYKQDIKLGEEYLVQLADFLRVSVSNPKAHTALVKDEIAFCLNYLKMQKIRFGAAIEYEVHISGDIMNRYYLPYFSLQPLIENVLKHNSLTEDKPVKVQLYEENGFIAVRNNVQETRQKAASAGNGLYNLKERYRLLGEDEIRITTDGTFFTVYLKLLER